MLHTFTLDDGTAVSFLVPEPTTAEPRHLKTVGGDRGFTEKAQEIAEKVAIHSQEAFEQAFTALTPMAQLIREKVAAAAPDETQVKMGLTLGADGKAVFVGVAAQMVIEVTMVWKK